MIMDLRLLFSDSAWTVLILVSIWLCASTAPGPLRPSRLTGVPRAFHSHFIPVKMAWFHSHTNPATIAPIAFEFHTRALKKVEWFRNHSNSGTIPQPWFSALGQAGLPNLLAAAFDVNHFEEWFVFLKYKCLSHTESLLFICTRVR